VKNRLLTILATVAVLVPFSIPAMADNGGGVEATYSESNGCGIPRGFSALASRGGGLTDSEPIRGPVGAMFGRTVGQARAALVRWTVPFSGGLSVSVHNRALPAFQQAANNLAASGSFYSTRAGQTFAFTARTVSGSRSISYHAFGAAIDVNSGTNPTADDLITDMPPWYVNAWQQAGFCWGGYWIGDKDPMHYSWMGPVATPGYGSVPPPYPSLAAKASFSEAPVIQQSALGGRRTGAIDALADLSGDGAVDSVRLKVHAIAGPIVEIMGSWADHGMCGFNRFQLPGADLTRSVIFGNTTFGSRPDIVFLNFGGSNLTLQIYDARSFYQEVRTVSTAAPGDASGTYLLADYDSDGKADLFSISGGQLQIWDGASGYTTSDFAGPFTVGADSRVLVGDRDLDGKPDLYSVSASGSMQIFPAASAYGQASETVQLPFPLGSDDVVRISDYDGDGHGDLYRLDANGSVVVVLGNQQIYADIDGWFRATDFTCSPDRPVYDFAGRFADDDGNPFTADIEWAATAGVTLGCNPPFNDWFCPKLAVTRGQMASFLVRALSLPDQGGDAFTDDAGSIHEADINRIAAAGITLGCAQGLFCPEQPVTREQMASFLVRAYQLATGAPSPFPDVTSVHSTDVAALYAAGVTTGCSTAPLAYCPAAPVLREQMAAFLNRVGS
jgi:D-alanyl-D-alanine carboxypeptidase/S-layer homology domain